MEQFIHSDGIEDGQFLFTLDMMEDISYDVELFAIFDCSRDRFSSFTSSPLRMEWYSPSGVLYEEGIYLTRDMMKHDSFFSREIGGVYRKDVRPAENGIWTMGVECESSLVDDYNLTGLGVRLVRKTQPKTLKEQ